MSNAFSFCLSTSDVSPGGLWLVPQYVNSGGKEIKQGTKWRM